MRFIDDDDGGEVVCPACTSEALLDDTTNDYDDDVVESASIMEEISKVNKLGLFDILNPLLLIFLVLALCGGFAVEHYLGKSQNQVTITSPAVQNAGNPILELSMYLIAIYKYAEEHSGRFPQKLGELYPDYVDKADSKILGSSDKYSYAADGKAGFVLSCSIADRFGFSKMYATGEGIITIE